MPSYVINFAQDNCEAQLTALIKPIFSEFENCPFVPAEMPELRAVASHYKRKNGAIWIATEDDTPNVFAGSFAIFQTSVPHIFELSKVYVAQSTRGSGLAQQLYDTALTWAFHQGMTELRLWTDTRFHSGHRFYEKLGFQRYDVMRYLADAGETWEYLFHNHKPTHCHA